MTVQPPDRRGAVGVWCQVHADWKESESGCSWGSEQSPCDLVEVSNGHFVCRRGCGVGATTLAGLARHEAFDALHDLAEELRETS